MSEKAIITTDKAPAPFKGAPYSQAVRFGDLIFVSGCLGFDPVTGEIVDGGITQETEQLFANLKAILEEAGSSLDKILRANLFLTDFADWEAMNEVYARHVGDRPPARATVEVSKLGAGARVEIDFIAHIWVAARPPSVDAPASITGSLRGGLVARHGSENWILFWAHVFRRLRPAEVMRHPMAEGDRAHILEVRDSEKKGKPMPSPIVRGRGRVSCGVKSDVKQGARSRADRRLWTHTRHTWAGQWWRW